MDVPNQGAEFVGNVPTVVYDHSISGMKIATNLQLMYDFSDFPGWYTERVANVFGRAAIPVPEDAAPRFDLAHATTSAPRARP